MPDFIDCDKCGGSGWKSHDEHCAACDGTGQVDQDEDDGFDADRAYDEWKDNQVGL